MQPYRRKTLYQRSPAVWGSAFLLLIILAPLLSGCASRGKLEVYESAVANVKLPILPDWEVQYEQLGEEQGLAYLTLQDSNSGVLVTRAPFQLIFQNQAAGGKVEDYFNKLVDISQGTFTSVGEVEVQHKSGYDQALAQVEMEQVAELTGTSSKGTLLLAVQGDQIVVAIFYCSVDVLATCELNLNQSVEGFKLMKP